MIRMAKSGPRRITYQKNEFEQKAWEVQEFICGIDEVGRGCLAGPLVAAAVIVPQNTQASWIKDSKIMTIDQREYAYQWLVDHAWYGVGIVHNRIVDHHAIWDATLMAMQRAYRHAVLHCPHPIARVVVDAMPLKLGGMPVFHFPKGEDISISIAAASIVAKVTRDRIMQRMDRLFPAYSLAIHKGYATQRHRAALVKHGPSSIHRMTFLKKDSQYEERTCEQQTVLC